MTAAIAKELNALHNWMMGKATVLYGQREGEIEAHFLQQNRTEIAEALVGEWLESQNQGGTR